MRRKVVLYISMSLDGFLAAENDDLSWLSCVENGSEDYGYSDFLNRVDTYIVGHKTFQVINELTEGNFPHTESMSCYVVTRKEQQPVEGVTFYQGDLKSLVNKLKGQPGKDIYCDGGAILVRLLDQQDLIDEYIISIIPIMLGGGKRLFLDGVLPKKLTLVSSKTFESGLVQLHYVKAIESNR